MNMNRWLGQMGGPPIEESALDLQPKIEVLGEQVPMLIAKGTYTGMGGQSLAGHVLLGASAELENQSIFIKLIAPEQLVNENRPRKALARPGLPTLSGRAAAPPTYHLGTPPGKEKLPSSRPTPLPTSLLLGSMPGRDWPRQESGCGFRARPTALVIGTMPSAAPTG